MYPVRFKLKSYRSIEYRNISRPAILANIDCNRSSKVLKQQTKRRSLKQEIAEKMKGQSKIRSLLIIVRDGAI